MVKTYFCLRRTGCRLQQGFGPLQAFDNELLSRFFRYIHIPAYLLD